MAFLIELVELNGRERLKGEPLFALLQYLIRRLTSRNRAGRTTMRGLVAFSLAAVLAAGCGQTAPAAPSPPSTPPAAPVPGAAPKAVLSIGLEGTVPTLGVTSHELVFDASRSTGDGLTYLVEFGDGASSTQVAPRHASALVTRRTARLTVTD